MKKLFLSLIMLLLFAGCGAETSNKLPPSVQIESSSPLNDKNVEKLLLESRSVDDFLRNLSQHPTAKAYTQNFIPVWESSSLQKSYSYCPRILMHNSDASFVMSIVGCPSIPDGREDVEILQWNRHIQEFELYSVHYQENQVVQIGEKNPAACMRCHRGGIAIGAHDAYTWPNTNLKTNTFNLARLAVVSTTGKSPIYESGAYVRSHAINRYKHLDVMSVIARYPFVNSSAISTFAEEVAKGNFEIGAYDFSSKSVALEFQASTPVNDFNNLLAPLNHQRNVAKSKAILGQDYEKYKYFLVAALSDCENFSKLYPASADFPDPYKSEEGYKKLRGIYDRIGLKVLEPRIMETNDFYRAVNMIKQIEAVRKVYYGFLSLGLDEGVKDLNFNPIKFTFHPSWGSADMLKAYLQDDDFAALRTIAGTDTITYLRARSGIPLATTVIGSKWIKLKNLFDQSLLEPKVAEEFSVEYDKLQWEDSDFIKYCQKIEESYLGRVER